MWQLIILILIVSLYSMILTAVGFIFLIMINAFKPDFTREDFIKSVRLKDFWKSFIKLYKENPPWKW